MAPDPPAAAERWLNEDTALGPWAGFSCPIPPRISSNPSSIRFWIETESSAEGPGRIGFRQPGIVHVCQCAPAEKRGVRGEAGLCINYKSKQKKREMEKMSSSYKMLCVEIMYGFTRERRPRHNIVSTSKNHDQAPVLSKVPVLTWCGWSWGVGGLVEEEDEQRRWVIVLTPRPSA